VFVGGEKDVSTGEGRTPLTTLLEPGGKGKRRQKEEIIRDDKDRHELS